MNGTKPKFITEKVEPGYYNKPDPYVNAPSCHVNLLELSRYAKKQGKKTGRSDQRRSKMLFYLDWESS